MKLSSDCMACLINKQNENLKKYTDENKKSEYMKEVLSLISSCDENQSSPTVLAKINELHKEYFGINYSFSSLKKHFNELMLSKEQDIFLKIITSDNRLLTALKLARIGNYIDFGALDNVNDDKLNSLIDSAEEDIINLDTYNSFIADLNQCENLVYITDNCGEIVLDKLLIKTIKELYPKIKVKVVVRGIPILNDATLQDAIMVGLTDITEVYGNGSAVAGTDLNEVSPEVKEIINSAHMIISKGQGNFESLHGCNLNIYYMFLCKCDYFVRRFNLPKFSGVFINEKNI